MLEWGFNMNRSLYEYTILPVLDEDVRDKHHNDLLKIILSDKEKYRKDIEEILDFFITDMGNSDFIRMVEKIKQKRII